MYTKPAECQDLNHITAVSCKMWLLQIERLQIRAEDSVQDTDDS